MDISCHWREKPLIYPQGPLLQQRNMSIAVKMRRKRKMLKNSGANRRKLSKR